MKLSIKIIPVFIILFTAIVYSGCSSLDDAPPTNYTVAFNSQFNDPESTTVMPNPTSITVEEEIGRAHV